VHYRQAADGLLDTNDVAGCIPLAQHVDDKQTLVKSICHFPVTDRVTIAFQQ